MLSIPAGQHDIKQVHFLLCFHVQRIVKMNKMEDDELGDEELSDEEIRALSEGLNLIISVSLKVKFCFSLNKRSGHRAHQYQSLTSFCSIFTSNRLESSLPWMV